MYRGFKLKLSKLFFSEEDYDIGKLLFIERYESTTQESIEKYVCPKSGIIDGTMLQEDWFPIINDFDIFISHSHKDKDLAIALAGWLYKEFELNSFIDSCIWGHVDDLLRKIDDLHCRINNKYDYNLRNYSTSHVHMMLNMALMKMINKTECLFFLNTPRSIKLSGIETRTLSPWIYSEIGISRLIEKKRKKRSYKIVFEGFDISHCLDLSHLAEINTNDLLSWSKYDTKKEEALDALYEMIPAPKKQ